MKYLKLVILIKLILLFYSCGTIKEGFTNQKKNSSEEFLVEKKAPLVMPPNYNELPVPGASKTEVNEVNESGEDIKSLISIKKNETDLKENNVEINQNLEDSLLEKIKKN